MPVVYCAVCQGRSILVEKINAKFASKGDFPLAASVVLRKVVDGKLSERTATWSKAMGEFEVHLRFKNNVTYLCITDLDFGKTLSNLLLTDIVNTFGMHYMSILSHTNAELDSASFQEFSTVLEEKMLKYSGEDVTAFQEAITSEQQKAASIAGGQMSSKKTARLKANLDDVKEVLGTAMVQVMAREDQLQSLDDRSASVSVSSRRFNQRSTNLQRSYFWTRLKQNIFVFVVLAIILLLIIISVCGMDFKQC